MKERTTQVRNRKTWPIASEGFSRVRLKLALPLAKRLGAVPQAVRLEPPSVSRNGSIGSRPQGKGLSIRFPFSSRTQGLEHKGNQLCNGATQA